MAAKCGIEISGDSLVRFFLSAWQLTSKCTHNSIDAALTMNQLFHIYIILSSFGFSKHLQTCVSMISLHPAFITLSSTLMTLENFLAKIAGLRWLRITYKIEVQYMGDSTSTFPSV